VPAWARDWPTLQVLRYHAAELLCEVDEELHYYFMAKEKHLTTSKTMLLAIKQTRWRNSSSALTWRSCSGRPRARLESHRTFMESPLYEGRHKQARSAGGSVIAAPCYMAGHSSGNCPILGTFDAEAMCCSDFCQGHCTKY